MMRFLKVSFLFLFIYSISCDSDSDEMSTEIQDELLFAIQDKPSFEIQDKPSFEIQDKLPSEIQDELSYCANTFTQTCDFNSRYQTFDGTCNNMVKPSLGSTFSPFKRYLKPEYSDQVNNPRTLGVSSNPLPNPRVITKSLSTDNSLTEDSFTHMIALFGQFIDHDITQQLGISPKPDCPCDSTNPLCFSVPITDNMLPMTCMKFVRSAAANQSVCSTGFREQVNQLSSFVDGSDIYGSTPNISAGLRTFQGGLLQSINGVTARKYLPQSSSSCSSINTALKCFRAGESRTNENMGLTSIQTLFMREHNRIASELTVKLPDWDDDRLFFETRKIVIGIFQHIIYNEWLSAILDPKFYKGENLAPTKKGFFNGYDSTVNPSLANEFSSAAFRFGHTLIKNIPSRYYSDNSLIDSFNVSRIIQKVDEAFNAEKYGLESILLGLVNDKASKVDTNVADTLHNHLFEAQLPNGTFTTNPTDLPATNINRARDHGVPPYNKYRKFCGLNSAKKFNDLSDEIPTKQINKLKAVYENVGDIDLFIGGLSEVARNKKNLLGPTLSCIIAKQFRDLKFGDRFFYENAPNSDKGTATTAFTLTQLAEIKKVTLAGLICSNYDVVNIQPNVFYIGEKMGSIKNQKVPCHKVYKMNSAVFAQ